MNRADERALEEALETGMLLWVRGEDTPHHHVCGVIVDVDLDGVYVDLAPREVKLVVPVECKRPVLKGLFGGLLVKGVTP